MKKILLLTVVLFAFIACNTDKSTANTSNDEDTKKEKKDSAKAEEKDVADLQVGQEEDNVVKLKFVGFMLGDAPHYDFVDEEGKEWHFGANVDKEHLFYVELSDAESNMDNQGMGPDPKLLNKWFMITHEVQEMPQYQDGPMGDVEVIVDAKLLEE